MSIGTEIGCDSLPGADDGRLLFQNIAVIVIPTGGVGKVVVMTDDEATTTICPLP